MDFQILWGIVGIALFVVVFSNAVLRFGFFETLGFTFVIFGSIWIGWHLVDRVSSIWSNKMFFDVISVILVLVTMVCLFVAETMLSSRNVGSSINSAKWTAMVGVGAGVAAALIQGWTLQPVFGSMYATVGLIAAGVVLYWCIGSIVFWIWYLSAVLENVETRIADYNNATELYTRASLNVATLQNRAVFEAALTRAVIASSSDSMLGYSTDRYMGEVRELLESLASGRKTEEEVVSKFNAAYNDTFPPRASNAKLIIADGGLIFPLVLVNLLTARLARLAVAKTVRFYDYLASKISF